MMDRIGKLLTAQEAAEAYKKHITTIYKAIQRNKLTFVEVLENSKRIKKVKFSDLVSLYGEPADEDKVTLTERFSSSTEFIRREMRDVLEIFFDEKVTEFIKPLEEQACNTEDKNETENKFLKKRLTILIQENEKLKEEVKSLSDKLKQVENSEKKEQINYLRNLKNELEGKLVRI